MLQPQMAVPCPKAVKSASLRKRASKAARSPGTGRLSRRWRRQASAELPKSTRLEPPSGTLGVENPVVRQIQPGQGQHVRRQIFLVGLELLEAGSGRFPDGDILGPAPAAG